MQNFDKKSIQDTITNYKLDIMKKGGGGKLRLPKNVWPKGKKPAQTKTNWNTFWLNLYKIV